MSNIVPIDQYDGGQVSSIVPTDQYDGGQVSNIVPTDSELKCVQELTKRLLFQSEVVQLIALHTRAPDKDGNLLTAEQWKCKYISFQEALHAVESRGHNLDD